MDDQRFDVLARRLGALVDRRSGVKGVLAGVAALAAAPLGIDLSGAEAQTTDDEPLDPDRKRRCRPVGKGCGRKKPGGRKRRCCEGLVCKKTGKKKRNGKKKRKCVAAPTPPANKCSVCANPDTCEYPTVQEAIDAAKPGSTVTIGDGTYAENLTIEKSLVLRPCEGATPTLINADYGHRTITIGENHRVEIIDIVIDAKTEKANYNLGGGISSQGPLTLSGSTVVKNAVWQDGGGITFPGVPRDNPDALPAAHTLMIRDDVVIEDNFVFDSGAGINLGEAQHLVITGDAIVRNNEAGEWGGAIFSAYKATVELSENALIDGNSAGLFAGALYVKGYADKVDLTMTGSASIRNNSATYDASGVYGERVQIVMSGTSSITKNIIKTGGTSRGGGINFQGRLTMNDSASITQNAAGEGAGVYATSSVIVMNDTTTIANNVAERWGGGLVLHAYNLVLTLNDSATVTGNSAQRGGGVFTSSQSATINGTSAITGNTPDNIDCYFGC